MSAIMGDIGGSSGGGGMGSLGGYASAAGNLLGGIGQYAGGMAQASSDAGAAKRSVVATQLKLRQQERQGFMLTGKAQAAIGAQGWAAESGSAASILRSNAQQLAMDHGIMQMQGSELESQYLTAASKAKAGAMGGLIKAGIAAVGIIAAPFTGGASLAVAGAATAAM